MLRADSAIELAPAHRDAVEEALAAMADHTPRDYARFRTAVKFILTDGACKGVACASVGSDTVYVNDAFAGLEVARRGGVLVHEAMHCEGHDHACSSDLCADKAEKDADTCYRAEYAFRDKLRDAMAAGAVDQTLSFPDAPPRKRSDTLSAMWSSTPLPLFGDPHAHHASLGECSICRGLGLEEKYPLSEAKKAELEARGNELLAELGADFSGYCKRPFPAYTWTGEDYDALRKAAATLNADPHDLLLTLALESDLNPHAAYCYRACKTCSPYPSAAGLNQITSVSANAMGITEAQRVGLLTMTVAEQLPYVVRSFLAARGGKPFATVPDAVTLYQTNIAPGTVPNEVLFVAPGPCECDTDPPGPNCKSNYCQNRGLDVDGNGQITRADLRRKLEQIAAGATYRKAAAELDSGATAGAAHWKLLLGAGLAAGAGLYAWREGWFDHV